MKMHSWFDAEDNKIEQRTPTEVNDAIEQLVYDSYSLLKNTYDSNRDGNPTPHEIVNNLSCKEKSKITALFLGPTETLALFDGDRSVLLKELIYLCFTAKDDNEILTRIRALRKTLADEKIFDEDAYTFSTRCCLHEDQEQIDIQKQKMLNGFHHN